MSALQDRARAVAADVERGSTRPTDKALADLIVELADEVDLLHRRTGDYSR